MAEQTLKEKTAKGLFWGGISNGVQQLLAIMIGIVLLKNLTPDDYGMVGMLAIAVNIASTIQESGFTAALTNRPEFKSEDYNAVFWFNLLMGCLLYLSLYFTAPLIAKFYDKSELILLSRVLFLSIIFSGLGIAHNAILFKKMMVKERAKIEIFSIGFSGTISIYLALKGFGYWALVINTFLYTFVGTIMRWKFSPWRPTLEFDFKPIKEMFSFSIKLFLSTIIAQVQNNIFSILLGKYYSTSELGLYSQGVKWAGMGSQFVSGMTNSVSQPVFSQIRSDQVRLITVFRKMVRFTAFISCPFFMGISFVCEDFFSLVNPNFIASTPILKIYCYLSIIISFVVLYTQLCTSLGRSDFYIKISIIYAIIQISAAFCVYSYGVIYLAIVMLVTTFFYWFIWHYFVASVVDLHLIDVLKDVFPYLLSSVMAILVAAFCMIKVENSMILFIGKIIITFFVYVLIMKCGNSVIFQDFVKYIKMKGGF